MKNKIIIEVVSAPGCSKCSSAKDVVNSLVRDKNGVQVREVNIAENPNLAINYGIMSTPAIIINGKLEFTSTPTLQELENKLKNMKGVSNED